MMRLVFLILFSLVYTSASAQTGKVLHRVSSNDNAYSVHLKWYSSSRLFYPEGCVVYRKTADEEWRRIATVNKQKSVPPEVMEKDTTLELFEYIIEGLPAHYEYDFAMLNVLIKTFESNDFAKYLGIYFKDETVAAGQTYAYKVVAFHMGRELTLGETPFIAIQPARPLPPPEEVDIQLDKYTATVRWKPDDDLFYAANIYRKQSNESDYRKINGFPVMVGLGQDSLGTEKLPDVFYKDDSLEQNVSYYYKLAGVDYFGQETMYSEPVEIFVRDRTPPPPPEGLTRDFKDGVVYLSWKNPPAHQFHHLDIYKSETSDGPFEIVNEHPLAATVSAYEDTGSEGRGYYYYVSAVDDAGNQNHSNKVFVEVPDLTPPAAPEGLTLAADTGKVLLEWKANQESDLMGYYIYRTVYGNHNETFMLLSADPVVDTEFTDHLPPNAKNNFLYKLVALDSAYNYSEPSKIVMGKMPDITPPSPPFLKSINAGEGKIELTWSPSFDSDLQGYEIYRYEEDDSAAFRKINEGLATGAGFADESIDHGVRYSYFVSAVDSAGNRSGFSNTQSSAIKRNTEQIKGISGIQVDFDRENRQVNIAWQTPEDAAYLGVVIYRKLGRQGAAKPITGLLKESGYKDTDLKMSASASYELRTYYKSGLTARSKIFNVSLQ